MLDAVMVSQDSTRPFSVSKCAGTTIDELDSVTVHVVHSSGLVRIMLLLLPEVEEEVEEEVKEEVKEEEGEESEEGDEGGLAEDVVVTSLLSKEVAPSPPPADAVANTSRIPTIA